MCLIKLLMFVVRYYFSVRGPFKGCSCLYFYFRFLFTHMLFRLCVSILSQQEQYVLTLPGNFDTRDSLQHQQSSCRVHRSSVETSQTKTQTPPSPRGVLEGSPRPICPPKPHHSLASMRRSMQHNPAKTSQTKPKHLHLHEEYQTDLQARTAHRSPIAHSTP